MQVGARQCPGRLSVLRRERELIAGLESPGFSFSVVLVPVFPSETVWGGVGVSELALDLGHLQV